MIGGSYKEGAKAIIYQPGCVCLSDKASYELLLAEGTNPDCVGEEPPARSDFGGDNLEMSLAAIDWLVMSIG